MKLRQNSAPGSTASVTATKGMLPLTLLVLTKRVLAAMLVGAMIACLVTAPLEAQAPGCYSLEPERWPGTAYLNLPKAYHKELRVRLDTAHVVQIAGDTSSHRLEPTLILYDVAGPRSATWRWRGSDSLMLNWTSGTAGMKIVVAVRADSLHGTATLFPYLVGRMQSTAPVMMLRVRC
jgi:hypothetical protein